MENSYILFTDGSCRGNPGPGGIGILIKYPDILNLDDTEFYRGFHISTNNRMELKAGIEGLKLLRNEMKTYGKRNIIWQTDSQYMADNIYQIPKWRSNNWETMNKEPVSNIDLWKELETVRNSLRIYPTWIPREENKEADKLANLGSKNPTYKDFGYNPGKIGASVGKNRKAPVFYKESSTELIIRIYKGDGEKSNDKCKIRFQILSDNTDVQDKYYAYTTVSIYNNLHRSHEYSVDIDDGVITKICKETK